MNPLLSALGLSKKEVMEYPESDIHFVIKYGEEIEQARGYNQALCDLESKLNTQEQMVEELMNIIHDSELCKLGNANYQWSVRRQRKKDLAQAIISQSPIWLVRKDAR